jgi:hypothetical protein
LEKANGNKQQLKGAIMKWRMRESNKVYICILCGESIHVGEQYIRPYHQGLDKPVSPPHKTTWGQRRPFFHRDCFENLKGWFQSQVPVYQWKDYDWEEV